MFVDVPMLPHCPAEPTPNPPASPCAGRVALRHDRNGVSRVVRVAGGREVLLAGPMHTSAALARWYEITGRAGR